MTNLAVANKRRVFVRSLTCFSYILLVGLIRRVEDVNGFLIKCEHGLHILLLFSKFVYVELKFYNVFCRRV